MLSIMTAKLLRIRLQEKRIPIGRTAWRYVFHLSSIWSFISTERRGKRGERTHAELIFGDNEAWDDPGADDLEDASANDLQGGRHLAKINLHYGRDGRRTAKPMWHVVRKIGWGTCADSDGQGDVSASP